MKVAETRPVGEERFCLVPDGGRSVGELQQGQIGLLHPLENSNVLPLGAQHPAPQQVEFAAAGTREKELTGELFSSDKLAKEGKKDSKCEDSREQCSGIKQKVMMKLSPIAC